VIYQQDNSIDISSVPEVFKPQVGPFKLTDYEKVYGADPKADIFELRGLNRSGVVVVVRPDHYVANALPLTATAELGAIFASLLNDGRPATVPKAVPPGAPTGHSALVSNGAWGNVSRKHRATGHRQRMSQTDRRVVVGTMAAPPSSGTASSSSPRRQALFFRKPLIQATGHRQTGTRPAGVRATIGVSFFFRPLGLSPPDEVHLGQLRSGSVTPSALR
jgi:hypothetical protein